MNSELEKVIRFRQVLGLLAATIGIVAATQVPARAATSNTWTLNRVAKDVSSAIAAGVGASTSTATYLPAAISMGPTIATGVAGSVGFATGGATKIAGDYLVDNPKTSIRTAAATVIGGDITSLPANLKLIVKNIVSKITIRSSR